MKPFNEILKWLLLGCISMDYCRHDLFITSKNSNPKLKRPVFIKYKQCIIIFLIFGWVACTRQTHNTQELQLRIDSLETKLSDTYSPGFGEFMSAIQVHHAKLWFAGQNQNWELADFEIHEIIENIEAIQKYQSEREESKVIEMIDPAIDSVNLAIRKKDPDSFLGSFKLLTNTCNNCHREVEFEFNVIKIPDSPPFSNQDFKAE